MQDCCRIDTFPARFVQESFISCKVLARLRHFLPDSCKIDTFLARFLQDWYISCKIRTRFIYFLQDSCKIDTFLARFLQDWYIFSQLGYAHWELELEEQPVILWPQHAFFESIWATRETSISFHWSFLRLLNQQNLKIGKEETDDWQLERNKSSRTKRPTEIIDRKG